MSELIDHRQRFRALTAIDSTLLVEAGAGSGKTALMAGRIVYSLAQGIEPGRIAAITFTELAAGQLLVRIRGFLERALRGEIPTELQAAFPNGLSDAQAARLATARERLAELTATTIHGFCQQLIRPYPVEADIDPGAAIMDAPAAELAWQDLLEAFLRERLEAAEAGGPLAAFIETAGANSATEIDRIARFLRRNRNAGPVAALDATKRLESLHEAVIALASWLQEQPCSEPTTVELVAELRALVQAYRRALQHGASPAVLMALAFAPPRCSAHTQKLTFRKWGRQGKWQSAATTGGLSKATGSALSREGEALYQAVGAACTALQGAIATGAFEQLAESLRPLLERYQAYKRDAALLDFDDLLATACALLRDPANEPVRCALSARYRYILVDEFQDTDPLQVEILWRLCGEGTLETPWQERVLRAGALFCVGDPKQAIYRFRGADVATYVAARERLRAADPECVLEITANFRSQRPILEWVNERFAAPLAAAGQPGFQPLAPTRTPPDDAPRVVRLAVAMEAAGDKPRPSEYRAAEAQRVAELCRRLIGSYPIHAGCRPRPCRAGDIALLAPSGTELWRYERALEERGIPVASQAGKGFFRRQEIQDLIAVTRVLADARDTVALGALLRGPLVGLTEEALLDIVDRLPPSEDGAGRARLTLWTEPAAVADTLARTTLETLQALAARALVTTPFALLGQAVAELHVRPLLLHRHPGGAERALANVERFLEMSKPYAARGLFAFAADMRARWEDAEASMEGRPDAQEHAVHLITMHSAKGLEWPIVIPVNTVSEGRAAGGPLLDRSGRRIHYYLGAFRPERYVTALDEEKAEQRHEQVRLLYVAFTRAEQLLVLPQPLEAESGWFGLLDLRLDQLPALDDSGWSTAPPERAPGQVINGQDRVSFQREAQRIQAACRELVWRRPSEHEPAGAGSSVADESSVFVEPAAEAMSTAEGGALRGTLLHKLMEEVLTEEVGGTVQALQTRAAELLAQLAPTPTPGATPAVSDSPAELAELVRRTLALPAVAALRARLLAEVPIYDCYKAAEASRAETLISGVADALALGTDGTVEAVIDWKSDIAPSERVRRLYREQVRAYLAATQAKRGLVVYMSLAEVDEITAA
ncbi:MAG: UvrD-helicase domain-containing protein [Nitrococcus mobilis]|nr:UvrD-helicase domain-containing protein [Nitrococcus mobilis]